MPLLKIHLLYQITQRTADLLSFSLFCLITTWLLQGSLPSTHFFCSYSRPLLCFGQNDVRIHALVCQQLTLVWIKHRRSSVSNAWKHTPIYGSPFNLSAFDLWLFPIASYVWIVSKYGLSSCSFSDRMSLVDHMQISIGNGNSPRLWLGAYCTPLIPVAPGFSWQCDLGRWRSLEPCFALCAKII